MSTPTAALLQPLKDRLAAATPGPWEWDDKVRRSLWRQGESTPVLGCSALLHPGKSDAALIAHAPTDQAKLIAAIEKVAELHHEDLFRGHLSNGCKVCGHDWPCATYTALTQALKGETVG